VTRRYIASAITLVIHLARLKGGVRRVTRISEITALDSGEYVIQDLFGFQQTGIDDRGIARGHFYATGDQPIFFRDRPPPLGSGSGSLRKSPPATSIGRSLTSSKSREHRSI
jgi:hypothetical protein